MCNIYYNYYYQIGKMFDFRINENKEFQSLYKSTSSEMNGMQ